MECLLHVGSAKTATSSLQQLLFDSRQSLAVKGWLYPTTGLWRGDRSHNTLGIYFWDNFLEYLKTAPFETLLDDFFSEIEGWKNIIVSSELIEKAVAHGNGNVSLFLKRLAERGYKIQIVYVVRRQDQYIDSQFKQAVGDFHVAYAGSVVDYIKTHSSSLTYAKTADAWQAQPEVSSVNVLPFREGRVHETFVDVLNCMGLGDFVSDGLTVPKINPSLDGTYLRLKHFLNRIDMPPRLHQRILTVSTNSGEQRRPEKLTLFTPEARQAFLRGFQDDHDNLAAHYGVAATDWTGDRNMDGPVFTPLVARDVAAAMGQLRQLDGTLADEIAECAKGKLVLS